MRHRFAALSLVSLLAAVPAFAQNSSVSFAQADYPDPGSAEAAIDSSISADATELALLKDVFAHIDRARIARLSNDIDGARAEDKTSADYLMGFVQKYKNHRLRVVFYKMAAERYLSAREWESAAGAAQNMVFDPKASALSKAVGARYALMGWQMLAVQDMKAGKIPPLKLVPSTARGGAAPKPRVPDLPWKMFVENADIYARNAASDPSSKLSAEEKKSAGGADLGQIQLIAAQVEFGYDNIEDAQRRFGEVIAAHPARADILETAVPYYLDTFKILKNTQGLDAALARIEPALAAEAKKAAAVAAGPGATEEQKKTSATLARLAIELREGAKGGDYNAAAAVLGKADGLAKEGKGEADGQYKQAGALFEKFAAENKTSPDAPNALFNAAIAFDKAKDPKKAVELRETLLATYPDAKVAQQTTVLLGGSLAVAREYAASAKYNQEYLTRWPEGPQRCVALQNLGVALQEMKKPAEAAQTYLKFAADPVCAGEDPNTTARLLYSAAKMQAEAKKTADVKKTLQALVGLGGVTDPVARSYQADAKERLAKMK